MRSGKSHELLLCSPCLNFSSQLLGLFPKPRRRIVLRPLTQQRQRAGIIRPAANDSLKCNVANPASPFLILSSK